MAVEHCSVWKNCVAASNYVQHEELSDDFRQPQDGTPVPSQK